MEHTCPRCGTSFERANIRRTTWCAQCCDTYKRTLLSTNMRSRAKYIISHAARRAKKQSVPIEVSVDWVQAKLEAGICEMTSIPFDFRLLKQGRGPQNPFCPSLDRAIPWLGYTEGNCRMILLALNAAIGPWGDGITEMIMRAWLDRIDDARKL